MKVVTRSRAETVAVGGAIAVLLHAGDVVLLNGELGGGKTALVSGIGAGLGTTDHVASPTFAITHYYEATPPIIHADLYRVESIRELEDIGFFDVFESNGVVCIEWSDRVPGVIPDDYVAVTMRYERDADAREIEISFVGRAWTSRSGDVAALETTIERITGSL